MTFYAKEDYAEEKKSNILNVKIVLLNLGIVKFTTIIFMRISKDHGGRSRTVIMITNV